MVAGVAAGLAAVFRTPLGAALLAVEVLYRDDFESDALVPAVLASVVAYSVVISIFGESTLFGRAPSYPFHAGHLPLYAALAVLVSIVAAAFAAALRLVEKTTARTSLPAWARPAIGGLGVGLLATPMLLFVGWRIGTPGQGLGILGGGYGAAQAALSGAQWLPSGWHGVELLLLLCAAKLVASAFTIGSGGSAGDFAPSLVLGGILGGAFGRAAQLLLHDPSIDPGAFALVGMGTFYGGIAHVPLSSIILVSELAGSYDLLVPLMLAEGIAIVALRGRSLYEAQFSSKRESPVHREPAGAATRLRVCDVVAAGPQLICFAPSTETREVAARAAACDGQEVFPVVDTDGTLRGVITSETLRDVEGIDWTIAADLMQPPTAVHPDDDLGDAAAAMLANGLRVVPIVDGTGKVVGMLDEAQAIRAFLAVQPAPA